MKLFRIRCFKSSKFSCFKIIFPSHLRWSLITEALDVDKITSSNAMEAAIMKYNVAGRMDFSGLHHYFEETVAEEEADAFFSHILPDIVRSCLALPDLVTQPIPLLKKRDNRSITLSQKQVILLSIVL